MSAESVKKTIQEEGDRFQLFMFNKRQLKLSFKIILIKRLTGIQNWHVVTFMSLGQVWALQWSYFLFTNYPGLTVLKASS